VGHVRTRRIAVLTVTTLAASQLGHFLAYLVRFQGSAAVLQAGGIHAYYPALAGVVSGVVGAVTLVGLAAVAATRLLTATTHRHGIRRTVRVLDLLPMLFLAQLAIFMVQETAEALAGGASAPSVLALLLFGTAGQLPAALLAGLVIGWFLAEVEPAWTVLLTGSALPLARPLIALPARPARGHSAPGPILASIFPAARRKRGPPLLQAHPTAR
jgi:hypothetical protein